MFKGREWWVVFVLLVVPAVGLGEWTASMDLTSGGASAIEVMSK